MVIYIYICVALNRTLNVDCYGGGGGRGSTQGLGFRVLLFSSGWLGVNGDEHRNYYQGSMS